jgi:arylsulfatase A-like enzyme
MGANAFPRDNESYAIIDGDWKLIWNVARAPGAPEFELFDFYRDPLDQKNLAAEHPEEVERLRRALEGWRKRAAAERLKSDAESIEGMTAEQLEQLRSLGYLK